MTLSQQLMIWRMFGAWGCMRVWRGDSYKDKNRLLPCRSLPASESLPAAMPVDRHHSPAGWLLQRPRPDFFPCRSLPASESLPAETPINRHHSPAGWLLQRQRQDLVFSLVGACLQANLCPRKRPLTATIRQQAGSYKDKDLSLSLVGDKPASESMPAAMPVDRHPSPAGWLLRNRWGVSLGL